MFKMTLEMAHAISYLDAYPEMEFFIAAQEAKIADQKENYSLMDWRNTNDEKNDTSGKLRGMKAVSYKELKEEAKRLIEAERKKRENECKN